MEQIKDRLKKAMELRQIRQQDIIDKIGISSALISQYISGKRRPKQDNIYRIASVLDVNPAWLMGCDTAMEWKDTETVTHAEKELLDQVRKLDDADRIRIMERISILLEQDKYNEAH